MNYILKDKKAIPEPDMIKWAQWVSSADRIVKKDIANIKIGGKSIGQVTVSTVFLGIDHSLGDNKEPLLFETMVFGGPLDGEMDRCSSYEAAEKMHQLMCEKVKLAVKDLEL